MDSISSCCPRNKYLTMAVLIIANLLNYMDRYTVAGVLTELQEYFTMTDKASGLLQTVFIVFYMICAPICGFLGDRYNRKLIMAVGLAVWIVAVLGSTFVGRDHYWIFLFCRGLVGVGEASYSTIAPTIIADIFTGRSRSTWLSVFYLMIPLGSGLGFAIGSNFSTLIGQWQWGIRLTPILGIVCLLMVIFLMENPERGAAEHAKHEATSLKEDLLYLVRHRTFIWSTVGFTAVVFTTGALSWWTPALVEHSYKMNYGAVTDKQKVTISITFGILTAAGGFIGVVMGSFLAEIWREGKWCCGKWKSEKARVYICAIGSLGGLPFLFAALMLCAYVIEAAWATIFIAITFMCFNWAVNIDVLLNVVVANRRSLANSIQTMFSHALGDAASPYLVGVISDGVRGNSTSNEDVFYSLRNAFFLPTAVLVISVAGFLVASFYVVGDTPELQEDETMSSDDAESSRPITDPTQDDQEDSRTVN